MTEARNKSGGARVRVPPPLVFLVGIGGGALLGAFIRPLPAPFGRSADLALASVLALFGLFMILGALRWFRRTGQEPQPWTPSPELIAQGPYRFSRNPIYIGMALLQSSLGLVFDNVWIVLLAASALIVVHYTAVLPEERYLAERFGDAYFRYAATVPRYLGRKSRPPGAA